MTTDLVVLRTKRGRFAALGMLVGALGAGGAAFLFGGELDLAIAVGTTVGGVAGFLFGSRAARPMKAFAAGA